MNSVPSLPISHVGRPSLSLAANGRPMPIDQVALVEALHDHLKGESAGAAVTLGGALDGQAGYGGVCADGEGVFLKAALLYLSSREVWF